jgi:lipopolysaccharide export system permease protein
LEIGVRTLSRYIRDSYLLTFVLTVVVFTFVMCIMVLFRIADLIAMGGSPRLIGTIFLTGIPQALGFSIPISVMTSALLTFGKLSANGEITAMKSSGIRMLQIIRGPFLYAMLMSIVCLYLQAEWIPTSYHMRRQAVMELGTSSPLQLLEEGRVIRDFPGYTVWFASKRGNEVTDIFIYQHEAGRAPRTIRARRGIIMASEDRQSLNIDLFDVRVDPFYDDRPGAGVASEFPLVIPLNRMSANRGAVKRRSDMTLDELIQAHDTVPQIYPELDAEGQARQAMSLRVEFHKRIVLALSCVAFVLLGAPLATRTHRSETTLGIAMSLVLVFVFYLFVIAAEALTRRPDLQPHLLVWMPIALAAVLGTWLIHRTD